MSEQVVMSEESALTELEKGYQEAEVILKDTDKLEELFQRLEQKMKVVPVLGDKLATAASMASLIKSYVQKEYTVPPLGTIIAAVSALAYFVSPIDVIPDTLPLIGHVDDAAIIMVCLKLIESDLEEFLKWREKNGKEIQL